ncbi:unnamed protein product [Nyctereutes procyonoides]|uniref:(raccoon dog) hypothetical protein n=1 Tax=Nyctereutes procyonoides TaxID=34880 RepID=A0A811Z6J3_NYCPR|nr:unnamed protein product [Nyctereutes procyonoides]
MVRGVSDKNLNYPEQKVMTAEQVKAGLIRGRQVWQKQFDVNILVSRHAHKCEAFENPSATNIIPSFVLLDIQASAVGTYVYELIGDDIKVKGIEYQKILKPGLSCCFLSFFYSH